MDLEKVATKGIYYNPASNHYNYSCNVSCDRCKTNNLPSCIGLGQLDLCLSCASDISKIQQTRRKQNLPFMEEENIENMTFMEQSSLRPPLMTMMQQSALRPSSQNLTRMEQSSLHPPILTLMQQSALRPPTVYVTQMEQSALRPLTEMAQSMFRSGDT